MRTAAVALHYFNVSNGRDLPDTIGSDLPDLDAVRTEAVKTAADLLRGECKDLWSGSDWKMIVTNESGHEVLMLRFSANESDREADRSGHRTNRPAGDRRRAAGSDVETVQRRPSSPII